MKTKILILLFSFLLGACLCTETSCAADAPLLLSPARKLVQIGDYTLDSAADKNQKAGAENMALLVRVRDKEKKLIKPSKIFLVDTEGKIREPKKQTDKNATDENSGESSRGPVSGIGLGAGGIGLNLGQLFGPSGTYAYTAVEFARGDFAVGFSLKIVVNKQEFLVPLTSLAEKIKATKNTRE